jgi:hypothetical protein
LLQSARYLQGAIVTMTGTFNDTLSMLEVWFFDVSRMNPGCTSLIRDGRGPSSCTKLQDQGRSAYSTLRARSFQTPGISSIYDVFRRRLEIKTSSITPFYWFTTSITRKFAEGALLPYF